MVQLIDAVRVYLRGIEQGNLDSVLSCYSPDATQVEWPNRLKAKGDKRGLDKLATDFERGRGLLSSQTYDVLGFMEAVDRVVVEVLWKGTLAVPIGKLQPGDEMVAHSAIAFDFSGGKIVAQRNYDCFEEF